MIRTYLLALLGCFSLFLISSCYYDKEDQLYPNKTCDPSTYTYASTIRPLIDSRCAIPTCHVSGKQLPDLSTYTGLTQNIARVKVRAIDLKTMPSSGPLSDCEITQLQKWIDAGTPNN